MMHRLREAMRIGGACAPWAARAQLSRLTKLSSVARKARKCGAVAAHKNIVLSLVERGGEARSFHVDSTKKEDIIPIVKANIAKETHVMTDELNTYSDLGKYLQNS